MPDETCTIAASSLPCPVPQSEDRLQQVFLEITRLEDEYHDPQAFRYNLNALLASLKSVPELLQREVERAGYVQEWNARRKPLAHHPALQSVSRGRNTTLHQRAIFDGSRVEVGLYRDRRLKLAVSSKVRHDTPSEHLLKIWSGSELGKMFLDEQHSATGEQYGVWRRYYIDEISGDEDVLTVVRRAIARTFGLVALAHELKGIELKPMDEEWMTSSESVAEVTVLLESDVDPSLPEKWNWV